MMLQFVTLFVSFNLFQYIENRICSGIDGKDECCVGFSLNKTTGKCEKCSNGYFGSDCSTKCIFPNYGEDCQYYCQCIKPKCHFSHGCLKKTATFNRYQSSSSAKSNTAIFLPKSTTIVLSLKKTFSYPVATEDSSLYTYKRSDTTVNYFPNNTHLLNNNVFVGFFGVFVLSFIVFVVAFIYLIFFRKKPNSIEITESEWKAPYQSLHLDTVGIQSTPYPVSRERSNANSTYLSPVFNQNVNGNTSDLQGHDIIPGPNVVSEEQALGRQRFIHELPYAENEFNVTLVNRADHVYIEIADSSEDNLKLAVKDGCESNFISSNKKRSSLDELVVYINQ